MAARLPSTGSGQTQRPGLLHAGDMRQMPAVCLVTRVPGRQSSLSGAFTSGTSGLCKYLQAGETCRTTTQILCSRWPAALTDPVLPE